MTASTPASEPSGRRTCGMPPPPLATTTKPARISASTAGASRISSGSGEATTRRQPFSPRSSHVSPWLISTLASASGRCRPIGLVGVVKPSSSASTSARVTRAALRRSIERAASSRSRASIRTKPSVACVCAPHQSSGTGGTTPAASSFLTRRLPTWGPLPCVMTTSWSCSSRPATAAIAVPAAAIWSSGRARPSALVMAFPPSASRTLMRPTLVSPLTPAPRHYRPTTQPVRWQCLILAAVYAQAKYLR